MLTCTEEMSLTVISPGRYVRFLNEWLDFVHMASINGIQADGQVGLQKSHDPNKSPEKYEIKSITERKSQRSFCWTTIYLTNSTEFDNCDPSTVSPIGGTVHILVYKFKVQKGIKQCMFPLWYHAKGCRKVSDRPSHLPTSFLNSDRPSHLPCTG